MKIGIAGYGYVGQAHKEALETFYEVLVSDPAKNMNADLSQADALIIATEWAEFKSPDFAFIKQELNTPVIFDGRNILNLDIAKDYGVLFFGIGRGEDSAYESQKNIINKIKNLEGV